MGISQAPRRDPTLGARFRGMPSAALSAIWGVLTARDATRSRVVRARRAEGNHRHETQIYPLIPFYFHLQDSRHQRSVGPHCGVVGKHGCSGRNSYFVTKTTSDRGGEITGDGRLHIRRWCTTRGRGCEYALVSSESYVYCSARGENQGVRGGSLKCVPF